MMFPRSKLWLLWLSIILTVIDNKWGTIVRHKMKSKLMQIIAVIAWHVYTIIHFSNHDIRLKVRIHDVARGVVLQAQNGNSV